MDQTRYRLIKQRGYHIDTRGVFPLLVHGNQTWAFETWDEALKFALEREGL